jgi:hypothetical protein
VRKYYDADGNQTGSSKGGQGGCGTALAVAVAVLLLVAAIALVTHG